MAVTAIIGVIAAGATVYGISQQRKAAKKAAKAQREANKARTAQAAVSNRARRAKVIRQSQLAAAQAENTQAGGSGAGVTSSMATGALATGTTQGAVNLANFAEHGRQGQLLGESQLALGRAQAQSNFGAGMVKLGTTILGNAQRIGGGIKGVMGSMGGTGGGAAVGGGLVGPTRALGGSAGDLGG
jgi:hypothetical protein